VSALERKAAAYDKIAKAYRLGTSEANTDRCVTEACFARELRDEALATRNQAIEDAEKLRTVLRAIASTGSLTGNLRALAMNTLEPGSGDKWLSESNSPGQEKK
jgi:vacuolar-type H+-ATPase subunit E/Vma4